MEKRRIANGIFWVEAPEADLRVLCGCPADSVKHLRKAGAITTTERDGVSFETGPNAILLSDMPVQHGSFSNLAEFPLLQMFYRQGMLLPGHPNEGKRPLLIGLQEQVRSQAQYFFRGNYGLSSVEEIMACGVPEETARELFSIKLFFAFGRIRPMEELVELRPVEAEAVMIAPGVYVHRRGFNRYAFLSPQGTVEVDLSLGPEEDYEPPYRLPPTTFKREEFSVIHIGEGDGWDTDRPCMGSIVCFRGRLYLIDAGPNIEQSLASLGIGTNEIQGIFHTHCHDDHFAGLPSLVHVGRKMRYFAAPVVRATAQKKMAALMGIREDQFHDLFETHDLAPAEWNRVDGFEVRPLYAPHPVETTVLMFRADCQGAMRTYAHLADISSFDVVEKLKPGTASVLEPFRQEILQQVDVKKLDAGGGLIHGRALDFSQDPSPRILFSHGIPGLSAAEQRFGTIAPFGATDVLIPAQQARMPPQGTTPAGRSSRRDRVDFLRSTRLFGSCLLEETLESAAAVMKTRSTAARRRVGGGSQRAAEPRRGGARQRAAAPPAPELYLLSRGRIELSIGGKVIETVEPGEFWGEEQIVHEGTLLYEARAVSSAQYYVVPAAVLEGIPSVRWKLFEAFGRRMRLYRSSLPFEWQEFFSVGERTMDEQHKQLFALTDSLCQVIENHASVSQRNERKRELVSYIRFHFAAEEELLAARGYPGIERQKREHAGLLARIMGAADLADIRPPRTASSSVDFLKEWLVRHTLMEDLLYKDFLREKT